MELITIDVSEGKYTSAKQARKDGQIPMVCYAKEMEPRHFTVDYQTFRRAYIKGGKSAIISFKVESGEDQDVLVQDVQYEPISDDILHVDVKAITKGQKISTDIPLVFVGESKAVKEDGGTLMTSKDSISIECLPKDLPHEIEVDISSLEDFHTSITVGDIKVAASITILDAEDVGIATVAAPREEEEETTTSAEAEGGEAGAEGGGEKAEEEAGAKEGEKAAE